MNAWMCARRTTTDHDLASVILDKKEKEKTDTKRDKNQKKEKKKNTSRTVVFFCGHNIFRINQFRFFFFGGDFFLAKWFLN